MRNGKKIKLTHANRIILLKAYIAQFEEMLNHEEIA